MDNEMEYCVIGKKLGGKKFEVIIPGPISVRDALRAMNHHMKKEAKKLGDGRKVSDLGVRIVNFRFAKQSMDNLNKVKIDKPINKKNLHAELENSIRSLFLRHASLLGREYHDKPVVDNIFIGHESYEVQITFKEDKK